jgi:hypothetical protein
VQKLSDKYEKEIAVQVVAKEKEIMKIWLCCKGWGGGVD